MRKKRRRVSVGFLVFSFHWKKNTKHGENAWKKTTKYCSKIVEKDGKLGDESFRFFFIVSFSSLFFHPCRGIVVGKWRKFAGNVGKSSQKDFWQPFLQFFENFLFFWEKMEKSSNEGKRENRMPEMLLRTRVIFFNIP